MASLRFIHYSSCKDDSLHTHSLFLQNNNNNKKKKNLPPQRKFHFPLNPHLSLPFHDLPFPNPTKLSSNPRIRIACSVTSISSIEREEAKMGPKKRCGKVQLHVRLNHQVKFGEHVAMLGSSKDLGSWKKKVMMRWTKDGWVLELELKGESEVEFKFVILTIEKRMVWEEGGNRVLKLPNEGNFEMVCHWNKTREGLNLLGLDSSVEVRDYGGNGSAVVGAPVLEGEVSPFVQEWSASFMRSKSNEHSNRETERRWNTEGGLEGLLLKLVEGDWNARNWWRKV